MPGAKQFSAEGLGSRIRIWLLDHPGAHRPRDIAAGLGVPEGKTRAQWTKEVGAQCSRMATPRGEGSRAQGVLERVAGEVMTRGNVPASLYRLPQSTDT